MFWFLLFVFALLAPTSLIAQINGRIMVFGGMVLMVFVTVVMLAGIVFGLAYIATSKHTAPQVEVEVATPAPQVGTWTPPADEIVPDECLKYVGTDGADWVENTPVACLSRAH